MPAPQSAVTACNKPRHGKESVLTKLVMDGCVPQLASRHQRSSEKIKNMINRISTHTIRADREAISTLGSYAPRCSQLAFYRKERLFLSSY